MKRIIILTLCVSILLPCSFTISAQSGWTEEDAWATGYLIGTGLRKIGERIDERREEERIRKEEQRAKEEAARRQAEEEKRRNIENKKIESEKQLQQLRESNSPYADCYSINENGDLVLNEYCADSKNLSLMRYVDLGLPSGTLWGNNSLLGFYTYDAAIEIYGHLYGLQLPSEAQFEELRDKCTWSWKEGYYQVIGPNGNCIYLLARGSYTCDGEYINGGYYWSSTLYDTYRVYQLFYYPGSDAYIGPSSRCCSQSVCIVKPQVESVNHNETHRVAPLPQSYVDLGLPSGTLWKNSNEGGDNAHYAYDEAKRYFGNKLPTKTQWEELKEKCNWSLIDGGYKVTGPNGNYIILVAAGHHFCDGKVCDMHKFGGYWSSTLNGSGLAWYLYFKWGEINMKSNIYCYGLSVRLVQNP